MYNYFIIEKDQSSINRIKNILEDFQQYNCIGTSDDNDYAMNIILKESPS